MLWNEINGHRIEREIVLGDALDTVSAGVFDIDVKQTRFETPFANLPGTRSGLDPNRFWAKQQAR